MNHAARRLSALLLLTAVLVLSACDSGTSAVPKSRAGTAPELRPDFSLPDPDGTLHAASDWDGQVLVVNFWATWCPPCRREIPTFIELQQEYGARGLQFVGIAMDEADRVRDFATTLGINYPLLVGEQAVVDAARAYGNEAGLLPYSAVVDRSGKIVFTWAGELTREQAEEVILPLL
ncbi:MAG: TlpA disulfide reductase family protein [Gammaproteobacteria bacterium]|nr:TlpA disulfide reductase family protein [Gammaproteobacteria bacterium]